MIGQVSLGTGSYISLLMWPAQHSSHCLADLDLDVDHGCTYIPSYEIIDAFITETLKCHEIVGLNLPTVKGTLSLSRDTASLTRIHHHTWMRGHYLELLHWPRHLLPPCWASLLMKIADHSNVSFTNIPTPLLPGSWGINYRWRIFGQMTELCWFFNNTHLWNP